MSFTGSVLYSLGDTSLEIVGIGFVVLNSLLVALTCVCEKHIVVRKDQTPLGYTLYRNAFAIPLLMMVFASGLEDPVTGSVALWQVGQEHLIILLAANVMLGALNGTIIFEWQLLQHKSHLFVTSLLPHCCPCCYSLKHVVRSQPLAGQGICCLSLGLPYMLFHQLVRKR